MTAETRAIVSWAGAGQPILLKVHGSDGEVAVQSIKTEQWGPGWLG